jgi:hypothetical protein
MEMTAELFVEKAGAASAGREKDAADRTARAEIRARGGLKLRGVSFMKIRLLSLLRRRKKGLKARPAEDEQNNPWVS